MNRRSLLAAGMLGSVSVVTGESLPAVGKIKAKKKTKAWNIQLFLLALSTTQSED